MKGVGVEARYDRGNSTRQSAQGAAVSCLEGPADDPKTVPHVGHSS